MRTQSIAGTLATAECAEYDRAKDELEFAHEVIVELQHEIRELRHEVASSEFIIEQQSRHAVAA